MDQKPPRPRTLQLSPLTAKKASRSGRHRRQGSSSRSKNTAELKILANNIRGILEDISFQKSTDQSRENILRRSYIGISRSAAYEEPSRYSRRDIVSAFYGENRSSDGVTRESAMHMSNRVAETDRYDRDSRLQPEVKSTKRQSCPWDLSYFGEDSRSLQILASELNHLREIRENEIRDLLTVNNKLQHDLFDADREICNLEDKNLQTNKRLEDMLRVYERIRENLKHCLEKVKDLETFGKFSTPLNSDDESVGRNQKNDVTDQVSVSSGFNTLSDMSEGLPLDAVALGYEGDGENSTYERRRTNFQDVNDMLRDVDSLSLDSRSTGCDGSPPNGNHNSSQSSDRQLLARLQDDINSLSQINKDQSQEIERLRTELTSCRKHMSSSQFQLEAVEIECSRLLAMEDQLVSVITFLQRARTLHMHRQILGDIILNAVSSSMQDNESSGIPADAFLRELQDRLRKHPQLAVSRPNSESDNEPSCITERHASNSKRHSASENKRFGTVFSDLTLTQPLLNFDRLEKTKESSPERKVEKQKVFEAIKFIDDEDDQLSDAESFHSLGKHLNTEQERETS